MKKIALLLVAMFLAAGVCEAKVYTGRLSLESSRGHRSKVVTAPKSRCSEKTGCRVSSMNNPACYNMAGVYIQAKTGYRFYPNSSFDCSLALGLKTYVGITAGMYVANQVPDFHSWNGGIYVNYEFAQLRGRTKLFYPVIGIDTGLSGERNGKSYTIAPTVGWNVGFNFVTVRDRLDLGLLYTGRHHFLDGPTDLHSGSYRDHSVGIVTRVYIF